MSVKFLGNTEWRAVSYPEFNVDYWGCDTATVRWRGRSTARVAFENSIKKWGIIAGYPKMMLTNWTGSDSSPSFPTIEFHFKGFRSGSPPDVKAEDSFSVGTASGSGKDRATGKDVNGSFTYMASRTTYTWFTSEKPPLESPYNKVQNAVHPLSRIISGVITDNGTGSRVYTMPYSAFVTVFNSLIVKEVVTDYRREELVKDKLWACQADVDYKVI